MAHREKQIICPICSSSVSSRNYGRHRRSVHGLTTSEPSLLCRRVSTDDVDASVPSRSSSTETPLHLDAAWIPRAPSSHDLTVAARALLTRHHAYSELELVEYLRRCYPEIPPDYRRPLVLGAVAGAQKAAHSHYAFEHNRHSPEEERRVLAANWASQLSFWNMGIGESVRRPSDDQPYEQLDDSNVHPRASVLSDRDLPVSLEQSCRDFDIVAAAASVAGISAASVDPEETTTAPTADEEAVAEYVPTPISELQGRRDRRDSSDARGTQAQARDAVPCLLDGMESLQGTFAGTTATAAGRTASPDLHPTAAVSKSVAEKTSQSKELNSVEVNKVVPGTAGGRSRSGSGSRAASRETSRRQSPRRGTVSGRRPGSPRRRSPARRGGRADGSRHHHQPRAESSSRR